MVRTSVPERVWPWSIRSNTLSRQHAEHDMAVENGFPERTQARKRFCPSRRSALSENLRQSPVIAQLLSPMWRAKRAMARGFIERLYRLWHPVIHAAMAGVILNTRLLRGGPAMKRSSRRLMSSSLPGGMTSSLSMIVLISGIAAVPLRLAGSVQLALGLEREGHWGMCRASGVPNWVMVAPRIVSAVAHQLFADHATSAGCQRSSKGNWPCSPATGMKGVCAFPTRSTVMASVMFEVAAIRVNGEQVPRWDFHRSRPTCANALRFRHVGMPRKSRAEPAERLMISSPEARDLNTHSRGP